MRAARVGGPLRSARCALCVVGWPAHKCSHSISSPPAPLPVLVPDLYKGKLGVDAEEASHVSGVVLVCVCVGGPRRGRGLAREWARARAAGLPPPRTATLPPTHPCAAPPPLPRPPQLMNSLDFKAAVRELKEAVDYLRATGSSKVFVSTLLCVCMFVFDCACGCA